MGHTLKQTVLVVENDHVQRELVSVIFEESDMHVIACMSVEAAAVVLEKVGGDLTLMFADADLDGDMSGVDLARIATERFPDLDLIVTSFEDMEDHIPDSIVFMPKPWLPLELLRQAEISRQRHVMH